MNAPPAVRVWWAHSGDARDRLIELLDPAERARYHEYDRPADRARFMTAAALLRLAVGRQLRLRPADVPLDRSCERCGAQHGRPRIRCGAGAPVLSVSHSGDSVVVAVGTGIKAVGVDVELIDPALDVAELASIALTEPEIRALAPLAASDRVSAFVRLWTRKEALLKALGVGLEHPPDQVNMLGSGDLLYMPTSQGEATVRCLNPPVGYHSSLAVICGPVPVAESDGTRLLTQEPQLELITQE
ncbi:MAG: 4'-phosphopantetheinyl transferase family protein [Streptosporangiaceae bacterium]